MIALVLCAALAFPARVTTYARHYSDSARVHPNARYSPDRLNVAVGWRKLYGKTLWLQYGFMRVKVKATDVMARRYDTSKTLHVDASPRVMKSLGLKQRAEIYVSLAE